MAARWILRGRGFSRFDLSFFLSFLPFFSSFLFIFFFFFIFHVCRFPLRHHVIVDNSREKGERREAKFEKLPPERGTRNSMREYTRYEMYKYRFHRARKRVCISGVDRGFSRWPLCRKGRIESCTSKVSRVSEDFTVRRSISCLLWITRDCDVVL